jgi:hypothetical protein
MSIPFCDFPQELSKQMPGLATLVRTNVVKVSKFNLSINKGTDTGIQIPDPDDITSFNIDIGTHLILQAFAVSPIYALDILQLFSMP